MTGTKVLAPSGVIFLDLHVWVAEADSFYFVPIFDVDHKFFTLTRRTDDLIERLALFLFSHRRSPRYGRLDQKP